jgi:hypothetical protein
MTDELSLYDRVEQDMKAAFRAGDKKKNLLLGSLLADAKNEASKKEARLPTDQEMTAQLRKFVANARTNADAFERLDRHEDANACLAEIAILSPYLPPEISEADIRKVLDGLMSSGNLPVGKAGIGIAMKSLKDTYGTSFDGKVMKPFVEKVLAGEP